MTSNLPIVRSLHKWTVRNSFIEVELPETSEICDGKKDAWTDERADIEYQTYPHLVLQSFVSRMPSPRGNESDLQHFVHWSSDSADSPEGASSSSSSSDEAVDVVLAPSDAMAAQGTNPKSTVWLSEYAKVPRHPISGEVMSIGSIQHAPERAACRPCEWMQRGRSCKYGWRCPFCHYVDEHTKYHRRRRGFTRGEKPHD